MAPTLEQLFRTHYLRLFRFVRRRVSNREDAEDIAQTVFAEAVIAFDRAIAANSEPSAALLYAIARRRMIDAARRAQARPQTVPLEEDIEGAEMLSAIDRSAIAQDLHTAIAQLPEVQRHVVIMKLVEGRPHAEIAQRLGITSASSRMHLNRGLTTLRQVLLDEGVSR